MNNGHITAVGLGRWLLSSLPSLVLLGPILTGILYAFVAPSIATILEAKAPQIISECFDKPDFDLGLDTGFKGKCSEIVETIVPIVVAEQVDTRFTNLEADVADLKASVVGAATIAKQNQVALEKLIRQQEESAKAITKNIQRLLDNMK